MENKRIEDMSDQEVKSLIYDQIVQKDTAIANINQLQAVLQQRQNATATPVKNESPEEETKKK